MKKETKELIQWINTILNDHKRMLAELKEPVESYDAKRKKAINFFDSLPEIESHLCRGGYIQDRNGTPCCHGDIIRIIVPEGNGMTGRLCWSDTDKSFSIRNAYKRQVAYFVHNLVFEKVEK